MTPAERFLHKLSPLPVVATVLLILAAPLAAAAPVEYVLDQSATEARFQIGENLMGRETTAVGSTSAVTGGVTLDEAATFLPFAVDVSTLTTDERMRDNQIRNSILQTNRSGNSTVTFVPAAAEGLVLPLVPGTTQSVLLTGDLTIKGVTREAAFELRLEVVSGTELSGSASTIVKLTDFGIAVPRVPLVARVDDEVELVLDFRLVAKPD